MRKTAVTVCALGVAVALVFIIFYILSVVCVYSESYADNEDLTFSEKLIFTAGDIQSENTFGLLCRKIRYMLTGSVSSDDVICGEGGFLFPKKTDKFDYESDYRGEYRYTDEQLGVLAQIVSERRAVYAKSNTEYYVFIIPNSQTVYDELTGYDGAISENTRAKSAVAYLSSNTDCRIVLLDEALRGDESGYPLYHNTENSINQLGAYVVSDAVRHRLPESVRNNSAMPDTEAFAVGSIMTNGRTLAQQLMLPLAIKNNTVYIDTAVFEERYEVKASRENIYVTTQKPAYSTFAGISPVVVQISSEYERSLIKPIFSAVYTDVCIVDSYAYSDYLISEAKPSAVIQIIREDELDLLFSAEDREMYDILSYGNNDAQQPELLAKVDTSPDSVAVFGRVQTGANVTVSWDGGEKTVKSTDGLFIAHIPVGGRTRLKIVASLNGYGDSAPVYTYAETTGRRESSVIFGEESRLFYTQTEADFLRTNRLLPRQYDRVRSFAESTVERIRGYTGKDTELIVLFAPNPLTVYSECAPSSLAQGVSEGQSRMDQYYEILSGVQGLIVLDIRKTLSDNKSFGKLYYQTDTHWTELGAYFAYNAIISEISGKYINVSPFRLNDFNIEQYEKTSGDLTGFLGIQNKVSELIPRLTLKYPSSVNEIYEKPQGIARAEATQSFMTTVSDETLPVGYVVRDSYAMQLTPLLSEHFSALYYGNMWDFTPEMQTVAEMKPDYVIYIITERNADRLFAN